jgi:MFS family permease
MSVVRRHRAPLPARRVGRYVLDAAIRQDAAGVLWRGTDTLLSREVVIREITVAERLTAEERNTLGLRLLRQWLAVARIRHPGAVTPFDVLQQQGRTYFVTERLDVPTLAEVVDRLRPCDPLEAAAIGRQLLDVLQAAHREGVVHGDVRPENVLMFDDGHVRLTNFSIAMPEGLGAPTQRPRSPFAPPKEVLEAGGLEGDLWSLGATLYWSLERELPPNDAPDRAGATPHLGRATALTLTLDRRRPGRRRPPPAPFKRARALAPVLEPLLYGAPEQGPAAAELSDQLDELFRSQGPAEAPTDRREAAAAATASTRALLALVAEGFASRLSFGLVGFALPLYARGLGLSLAAIGMLASLNTVVALVLKPVMGAAADRYGRKRTLGVAMALRSVLALLYAVVTTPWGLYAVRAGHGLADSMRDPSVTALIADNGGKKAVASAFAWYQTAKTMAGSVGKSVAGVLLAASAGSYATVFAAAFALSALPLLVVAAFVRDGDSLAAEVERPAPPTEGPRARTRPYVVLGFLVSGAASMLGTLFPILATEYAGLSPAQAGALYLATPALALSGPVFGWLADHVSSRLVLSLRSVANVGSSLLYLFVPAFPGFLTGRALDDLGKAAFKPAWGAIMAEVSAVDRGRRARTMSWMSAGEDAGDIAAPVVAGLLWTAWGAPAVLIARAGLAAAAEAWALLVARSGNPSVLPDQDRRRPAGRGMDGAAAAGPRSPATPPARRMAPGLVGADHRTGRRPV